MIVGITLSKRFADRYGKRDVFGVSLFISTIFIAIFFLYDSKSVFLMFSTQVLHGFFYGITIPLLWAMIADVADYSEWKNDRRATAIIFSAMMVGLKGGLSIGSAFVTYVLSIYNYSAIENSNIQLTYDEPDDVKSSLTPEQRMDLLEELKAAMKEAAKQLDFEEAARLRDRIFELEQTL